MRNWGKVSLDIMACVMIAFFLINVSATSSSQDTHDAQSIGFYSNGCIAGAKTLPIDGVGYQVMRTSRNRYYGHPNTVQFIQKLAKNLDALNLSLLLGDIGQAKGGPLPFGHASHQIGLDIDIWFWNHPEQRTRSLTQTERDELPLVSMLDSNGVADPVKFNETQITKLRLAASDSMVQRIFINPALKVHLCKTLGDKSWLQKLRPWPGHDEHFHVRLFCPSTSLDCVSQDPVPPGDGCQEAIEIATKPPIPDPVEPATTKPELPKKCVDILGRN